jgi:hypothetical protein
MHTRRLSAFLLGIWIAGTIAMAFVATQNFRAVDRLLEAPGRPAAQTIELLGHDKARALLRYQVAELNRFFFESWEYSQLLLALVFITVLVFAFNGDKLTAGIAIAMLGIVVAERFLFTPEIVALGRAIDFVPFGALSPERQRFWRFHMLYSAAELLKLLLGAILGVKLLLRSDARPRLRSRDVDPVDYANHRHVDR